MRTSRISQDTSKLLNAAPAKIARTTRSSLTNFSYKPGDFKEPSTDIEDVVPSKKRKREATSRTPVKKSPGSVKVKTEIEEVAEFSPVKTIIKDLKARKPPRQVKNEDGEIKIHPPNDWAEIYAVVKDMRLHGVAKNAVVDTMGCESLGDDADPKKKRFHTLIALMLSSQTKDTTNAATMKRLKTELLPYKEGAPFGLNMENILAVEPGTLNQLIWSVGFHNNKTRYIKEAVEILRDKWNGDIPNTAEGLMSLPGVGPKMAYLCLSAAWGRTEGIGVDVHVHRITNMWGWHKTKDPEATRIALQAWLPRELWHEINWLLVGFGQTICPSQARKCGECELGLRGMCKAAERAKVNVGRKIKEEKIEDGHIVEEKIEIVDLELDDVPVNAVV
ncbi:DNA glycosylase [Calycina marina]|uniref:Endonuclease III homolog n=1 Tax=Calycina marina TaxID=1763456 RepID=A0A9P7Z1E6_9HELO|nr:DNA glycosylase [Calycina marina]